MAYRFVTTFVLLMLTAGIKLNAHAQDAESSDRPPNVVLILADDLGYGQLSCYGGQETPTPHIDSIAQDGVRFTDGYVTAGTCSPSRAALVSGRYQQRFGFEFNTLGPTLKDGTANPRGIDSEVMTVADILKTAGYRTGLIGKWHLGFQPQFHPMNRGFDEFFGILNGQTSYFGKDRKKEFGVYRGTKLVNEQAYMTDVLTREAVSFIKRHSRHPFFLYMSYTAVHKPFEGSERDLKQFSGVKNPRERAYRAMTVALDIGVGQILAELRKQEVEDQTIVIFLSDNGAAKFHGVGDNGPFRLGKVFLFEGGVRVPFLMTWPGHIKPGTDSRLPVSALDLLPTIAAASGAKVPDDQGIDGVDLLPWLTGAAEGTPHGHLFWRNGPNHAVRRGKWKLIQARKHVWLFDLNADPGEIKNLANQHPDVVRELQQAFEAWQKKMQKPAWPSRSDLKRKSTIIDGVEYEFHI